MRLPLIALVTLFVAASLGATPVIHNFDPQEGFSFASTRVTITGTGFADGAVTVLFDDVPATVLHATATTLQVMAHPKTLHPAVDQLADITVRVAGHGEAKLVDAFFFHLLAQGHPSDYTAVLVPLTSAPLAGAHGSVWESELHVFNSLLFPLRIPGPETFILTPPGIDPAVLISPRSTQRVLLGRRTNGVDGHFLYVPAALGPAAKMSLRVRDTSQNAGSAGTDVPVVSHQAAPDIQIIDVPIDDKSRATLRIYGFTDAPMRVGVTVFRESGDAPVEQYDVSLHGILTFDPVPFPPYPAYLALDPFTPAVRAAGGRVRIELTNYGANVSPPLPNIWAFVSLTNNETNQVTVITPK